MWNISKKTNRRVKRKKIWVSGSYSAYAGVLFMPDSLNLVWGHSVNFAKFPILPFLKHLPIFIRFHPNLYKVPNYGAIQAITFLAFCQKLQKLWHFEFFLNTRPYMLLKISECHFSHNFHWSQSNLYENIGYHGKSKCLLEYCNQKLASST